MTGRGFVVMSLTALASLSCEGGHPPTDPTPTTPLVINGRVIDYVSGSGVSRVGVSFGVRQLQTDTTGRFTVEVPPGDYEMRVAGEDDAATVLVRGPWSTATYLARGGTCTARYGAVLNARTGRPIAGATISLGAAVTTTDADGWYRADLGCTVCNFCNLTILNVSAVGFQPFSRVFDRGLAGVQRLDIELALGE
ncbi:MAG: hypothetical protein AB7N65_24980 [Vicinamibacterales bacterium]